MSTDLYIDFHSDTSKDLLTTKGWDAWSSFVYRQRAKGINPYEPVRIAHVGNFLLDGVFNEWEVFSNRYMSYTDTWYSAEDMQEYIYDIGDIFTPLSVTTSIEFVRSYRQLYQQCKSVVYNLSFDELLKAPLSLHDVLNPDDVAFHLVKNMESYQFFTIRVD